MKIREVIISWDTFFALIVAVVAFLLLPNQVAGTYAKDAYLVGITVLSTIAPMFFAALAIITSLSDNDFIDFLEEDGTYSALLQDFGYSLSMMLAILVVSILLYFYTQYELLNASYTQPQIVVVFFMFGFSYALFAGFLASNDAIKYLKYRTRYLSIKNKKDP